MYIDDVAATVRTARLEVTKDLMAKGLLPKGEIKGEQLKFLFKVKMVITYLLKELGVNLQHQQMLKKDL